MPQLIYCARMPKPKYSLEALEKLRETQVDEATKLLGEAIRAREASTARRQSAEATLEQSVRLRNDPRRRAREARARRRRRARSRARRSVGARRARELAQLADAVAKRKEEEVLAMQKEAEARAAVR